jgi:hypothetical protein
MLIMKSDRPLDESLWMLEGRYKGIEKREFKLPWRKVGQLKSPRLFSGFEPVGCQWRNLFLSAYRSTLFFSITLEPRVE